MSNFKIKEGIDSTLTTNAYIPVGALIMKATAQTALSNYDTDAKCIAAGFVPCDGRFLDVAAYEEYLKLFEVIGYIYGGTGSSFKVPDLSSNKRYLYGQSTQSGGIYTPSFSNNTTNSINHTHTLSEIVNQTLLTNNVAGSHSHSLNYSTGADNAHSHYASGYVGGMTLLNPSGALSKSDGTGTAAGAAHLHYTAGYSSSYNVGNSSTGHYHSGTATGNFSEETHSHNISSGNIDIVTTGLELAAISVLYFVKI